LVYQLSAPFVKHFFYRYAGIGTAFLIVTAFVGYFAARYDVGFNGASLACLNARLFLVDTWDQDIKEGDLVAFSMQQENDYFPRGLKWIKIAAGKPNSNISIEPNRVATSSGRQYHVSMNLMITYLKRKNPNTTYSDFTGETRMGANEWFVLGETPASYDSRYWGPIKTKDIIGKAYAIL
jgi:conjugal transfer pilin signal peptidase TrbI